MLVFGVRYHIIVGDRAQKLTENGQKRTILVLQRRILTNLLSSVAQKRERRPIFFSFRILIQSTCTLIRFVLVLGARNHIIVGC